MARDEREMADTFDLFDLPDGFHDDPFAWYRALREHQPVKPIPGGYLLTRYADCEAVYRDAKSFSSDKKVEFRPKYGDGPLYAHHTTSLVFNDPPLHTRVRKMIMGALLPRALAAMEPGLIALIDRLLDEMAAKERVDLIEDFAAAIPIEVIGNLLGVPHGERGPLRGWSLAILGALEPKLTEAQLDHGNRSVTEFLGYLETLTARRRAAPGDPETDVLTRLIEGEVAGEKLSHEELLQNCIFLLNAGHETTTNIIGNCLSEIAARPEVRAALIADPALLQTGIEEFLRWQSPNQLGNRISVAEAEIGGVEMPAGTQITLCIGAANRDPEAFPDPETFDLERRPNRHLAFAAGPHQCAGMNVARMEARHAVTRFLARFPEFRLDGEPTRGGRVRFRGFAKLPARVG